MKNSDETILEILQGHKTTKWPTARMVKVFVSSTKSEFPEERRLLLEFVGPELQVICDEHQIEVEFVDMHYGAPERDLFDPLLFQDHLHEIRACHKISRGCFFLCLIGNQYGQYLPPDKLDNQTFLDILSTARESNVNCDILEKWYKKDDQFYILQEFRKLALDEWRTECAALVEVLQETVSSMPDTAKKKLQALFESTVELQFKHALGLAPGTAHRILCVMREYEGADEADEGTKIDNFKSSVKALIPEENRICFTVPWKPGGINHDDENQQSYFSKFKMTLLHRLDALVKKSLTEEPELKSRKKIVEENFQENITHLTLCFEQPENDFSNSEILDGIKKVLQDTTSTKHPPIFIYGNQGSGKTSLLKTIYAQCEGWFSCRVLRLVKFISATPRAAYNLELLRITCQQICIALKLPEGFLPKDSSFDPLYVNNWFQGLLRKFEDMNQVLIIFLDDLHVINPLDSDIISTLSWLPISLPKKVHIICTTSIEIDQMRLTALQKERFKSSGSYFQLTAAGSPIALLQSSFEAAEEFHGKAAITRLSSLLTCSEYGLSETELLEILMPTSNSEPEISIENGNFNFSSLCSARRKLSCLLREKVMDGKLLIEWSHHITREYAMRKYLSSQETLRNTHAELASLFFSEFCEENSESEDEPAPLPSDIKETPFKSTLHRDVTYNLRHVEESWIHLLKAGDILKLKSFTICNYDFLLAALQTFSVSYVRCLLEHVRCYLLDREIELIYHSIRRSTDVLTKDTYQLGTQLIAWLRPVTERGGGLMSSLVTSAMAWCDGFTLPLVVPLTDWLQPPLPPQARSMSTPGVRLVESTPSGQHILCVVDNEPQLWHIMSNQLVHTFKGHNGKVLCMAVTKQSQYLLTGSEDTSIIVWDLRAFALRLRIYEHIAPVLCITSALNNAIIISGGEDSRIIISSLATGKVVTKIDHHRGPVTAVKVTSAGDVLVSGSHDGSVCLWSLESFTILNTIQLQLPVQMIDISSDSVFLLACCSDNNLYLRTVATGTELHSLNEHKAKVRSICLTQDSFRALCGCSDGRVYIYDVHSGKLKKTLSGQSGEVTAVRVTDKDDFLLTAGGNRVLFYHFRSDDIVRNLLKLNKKSQHHLQPHTGFITCLDISRDGQLSVTGGTDHLVNIWQLNSHEMLLSLSGHTGIVTSVNFSPNGLFVATGAEDKSVRVWGLTLGTLVAVFKGHQAPVTNICVLMDSSRVLSSDRNDSVYLWLADNGNLLRSFTQPSQTIRVTNNMKYALGTDGDTTLKIWSLSKDEEKYSVSHSEEITCFVLTMDSQHVITGSRDMSLKVWQVAGGKLSQVLIGHTDSVTCVAVSVSDKSQIVSGSYDNNLIVWDINTGADLHTLSAHLSFVTCVKASGDGSIAISGSDDKSIIVWDTKRGLPLTSLQLHYPVISVEPSSDFSRVSVLLKELQYMPIICLHNTPAKYVKLPTYCAPDKDIIENPKPAPKRQMRRLLKKEVSLDTYTWQKKYAHLTSNLVIPAVDERFKRRFSVSASMEEISKIPQKEGPGMGSKQASLAQSQHFDQLEALWNKRSPPPRRRLQQSLSKQSSLAESHLDFDEDESKQEEGQKEWKV